MCDLFSSAYVVRSFVWVSQIQSIKTSSSKDIIFYLHSISFGPYGTMDLTLGIPSISVALYKCSTLNKIAPLYVCRAHTHSKKLNAITKRDHAPLPCEMRPKRGIHNHKKSEKTYHQHRASKHQMLMHDLWESKPFPFTTNPSPKRK